MHIARADETCGDGYTLSVFHSSSTTAAVGGSCYPGYVPYTGNLGNFKFVLPSGGVVCPTGQHMSGGTCVSDTQGNCANGFHDADIGTASAVQPVGGSCYSGFQPQITNRNVAYLIVSSKSLCGSGEYPTASGCGTYATGDCPTGYFAVGPNAAFKRAGDNDVCATNYSSFGDTDLCLKYLGANMAEFCTPQLACNAGVSTLRTSTGVVLPVYGESVTTPSMHFSVGGNVCHMNLLPGTTNNTVNVQYNNQTYHGVE